VLFDLDNTLIDFWKMKKAASRAALDAMIRAGLRTDKRKAWTVLNRLFDRYGIENQSIFDIFLKEVAGGVDVRLLAAGVVAYRRAKELNMRPYPGVAAALRRLGMRTVLAKYGHAWKDAGKARADHEIDDIRGILEIV